MTFYIGAVLFIFGAAFGSFAGAMAWRIRRGMNVTTDRSECEHCHHKLAALDLIPIVSWLALKGKCRYCHKPIGVSMVLVEVILGAMWLLSYVVWPLELNSAAGIGLLALWFVSLIGLAILFLYDLRWYQLPSVIVWPLGIVGLAMWVLRSIVEQSTLGDSIVYGLISLVPIAGIYGLLYVISSGKWIGDGDVRLGVFMGLALGWQQALVCLVLANLIGFLYILPGLATKKLTRTSKVPFGPFLIIACIIAQLWGQDIIDWYQHFLIL